jgi:hypothetical protein
MSIAIYDADSSVESHAFVGEIIKLYQLDIIMLVSEDEGKRLADRRKVEGILIIQPGFGDNLNESQRNQSRDKLLYTAAPGTRTLELIGEILSLALLHMRAEIMLMQALSEISGQAVAEGRTAFDNYTQDEPVISAVFHGELQAAELFMSPEHGLAAVFMTLAFLISVLVLPGREKSLISIYSPLTRVKDYIARAVSVLLLFLAAIVVYFLSCAFIYGHLPLYTDVLACAALVVYCVGLGAVSALLIKDKRTGIYIYMPFVLLNMTIGGAVWERMFGIWAPFKLILPTAIFLDAIKSHQLLESIMMAVIGICFIVCGGYFAFNKLLERNS